MPFIGIIGRENDSNYIKNKILKNSKKTNFEVININKRNLENIKNVRFDVLIINQDIDKIILYSNYLKKVIDNTKFLIINSDITLNDIDYNNKNIITFGFNSNSVITISSIKEESVMICIQKKILGILNEIEEQEISVKLSKYNVNKLYNTLAIFTVLQIFGEMLQKN